MIPFLVIFGLIGAALVVMVLQRRIRWLRRLGSGLLVSYITVGLILSAGELYFRYAFAQSENIITLACQNWLDRYWKTNSLGFRDREWRPEDYAGKKTVLVLGDSFAAGWGIEDPADRFSDVLGQKLGDGYAVMNLAVYGTATAEQLEILRKYPVEKPDVVILQYFLNDINYTGLKLGLLPTPQPTPELVRASYLANFLYWRVFVPSNADTAFYQDWWKWSYDAYDNPGIWSEHRQEIEDFISYVDAIGARLIVVIFPNMLEPVRSIPYIDRVAQVFESRSHPDVLKLFDQAAAWSPETRMVSARDSHPSVAFHQLVGVLLYDRFFQQSGTGG